MGRTLAEKVWDAHVVRKGEDGQPDLLYIDLHLVHEVTSPQAFEGLRLAGRRLRRPDLTIATEDHNTPTIDIDKPIADPTSRTQIETLRANCAEFGVRLHSLDAAIEALQGSPASDILQVQRLKKRKLVLRDRMTFIEDQLTPDIIA